MFSPDPDHYTYDEVEPTVEKLFQQFARAGKAGTVLDVGCGNGLLGEALNKAGHSVTGIESHPAAVTGANHRIGEVIEADLTVMPDTLSGRQFDYLLFADVLEHTADPLAVLTDYGSSLTPDGRLVISLPNIAVWDNRLRLLFGSFNYSDSGVMDRTHLRFFTFATARRLVETAGFEIEQVTLTPGIVRAFLPLIKWMMGNSGDGGALMNSPAYKFYAKYILPGERLVASLLKGFFGFRIVIVARRTGD